HRYVRLSEPEWDGVQAGGASARDFLVDRQRGRDRRHGSSVSCDVVQSSPFAVRISVTMWPMISVRPKSLGVNTAATPCSSSARASDSGRSEEHTSELQSRF